MPPSRPSPGHMREGLDYRGPSAMMMLSKDGAISASARSFVGTGGDDRRTAAHSWASQSMKARLSGHRPCGGNRTLERASNSGAGDVNRRVQQRPDLLIDNCLNHHRRSSPQAETATCNIAGRSTGRFGTERRIRRRATRPSTAPSETNNRPKFSPAAIWQLMKLFGGRDLTLNAPFRAGGTPTPDVARPLFLRRTPAPSRRAGNSRLRRVAATDPPGAHASALRAVVWPRVCGDRQPLPFNGRRANHRASVHPPTPPAPAPRTR